MCFLMPHMFDITKLGSHSTLTNPPDLQCYGACHHGILRGTSACEFARRPRLRRPREILRGHVHDASTGNYRTVAHRGASTCHSHPLAIQNRPQHARDLDHVPLGRGDRTDIFVSKKVLHSGVARRDGSRTKRRPPFDERSLHLGERTARFMGGHPSDRYAERIDFRYFAQTVSATLHLCSPVASRPESKCRISPLRTTRFPELGTT